MINITQYCKLYSKHPSNFLDNPSVIRLLDEGDVKKTKGRYGKTELAEKHMAEFLLWLHDSTRKAIKDGYTPQAILKVLDEKIMS